LSFKSINGLLLYKMPKKRFIRREKQGVFGCPLIYKLMDDVFHQVAEWVNANSTCGCVMKAQPQC